LELNIVQVVRNSGSGKKLIVPDTVFFHLQGGGQPDDKLKDINNNQINIVKENNKILLEVDPGVISNGKFSAFIDESFRSICSRLHSAGHLIALILSGAYATHPVKASHFPGESYIKFSSLINEDRKEILEASVNTFISSDNSVNVRETDDGRFVEFTGIGGYLCGGTHVKSLSEIGVICIDSVRSKKGQTTVKYSIG